MKKKENEQGEKNMKNSADLERFDRRVKIGTRVLIEGSIGWCVVKSIHPTRKWIQVEGWVGSFQRGHVLRITNK